MIGASAPKAMHVFSQNFEKKNVYFLHGGCDQVISPQGKTQLVGVLMGHCQAVGKTEERKAK